MGASCQLPRCGWEGEEVGGSLDRVPPGEGV